jgi:disulfide bond formation protein DsbB
LITTANCRPKSFLSFEFHEFYMSIDATTTFFALATVSLAFVMAVLLGSFAMPKFRGAVRSFVGPIAFGAATTVAVAAMAGSLYLSEVAHFTPCRLCWYQRMAMYPSALILLVALLRRRLRWVRPFVAVLCAIGALISSYHVLIERFPNLESSTCDPNNPCSLKWVEKFGFITIPVMALTAFVAIICLLTIRPTFPKRQSS